MARKKKDPAQEQEAPAGTAPEVAPEPDPVPAPPPVNEEPEPAPEITPPPEPVPDPEQQQEDPAHAQEEPDPVPPGERPTPYRASVAVPLAVVHKEVGLGTADMLKAVGSLRQGTPVTVMSRKGSYALLKNGLYILEALLEVRPIS